MSGGKDIKEFFADLDKFAKQIDVDFEIALKKIIFECWTRIIQRSPVDTGRFRSSWTLQEGTPNVSVKADGKYQHTPPMPQLALANPFTMVWINNSLPYAERLEFGSSKQAPEGMVRLTVHEVSTFISSVASKA